MAKPKLNKDATNLLSAIADATKRNEKFYVTQEQAISLKYEPALIEIDTNDIVENKAAARATAAGIELAAKAPRKGADASATPAASSFAIITNAVPPVSKRGSGASGAPSKYPFDQMEVGQSFFIPVSEDTPDPVKSLQSSVASANHKYSEETGEMETVERTKRGQGNKAVVVDGKKVKETVQRSKRKALRKFIVRAVEANKVYGGWTAPASGALVTRVNI